MTSESDLDSIFQTAYNYEGYGQYASIRPNQHSEELRALVETVAAREPNSIMEIGTDLGGTLYVFTRYLDPEIVISIDLYNDNRRPFFEAFSNGGRYVIQGNSHEETIKNDVVETLNGEELDLLLIDGDHSYEGVRRDLEMYEPLVRDGGIVAFHDITERPDGAWFDNGVYDFWTEVKDDYDHDEFVNFSAAEYEVDDPDKQARIEEYAGIGVLYK